MNKGSSATAILLFAHGSSVGEANGGVHELARQIEQTGPYKYVRAAFLELAQPNLSAAVGQAVDAGFRRVIVIPYFLTLGIHLQRDLPNLLAMEKSKHPEIEIEAGESLEGHPLMPSLILGRIQEALEKKKPR